MGILRYLAMTAAELQAHPNPDFPVAWMSCHFSPNNRGLSNIPTSLPADSMLILDDSFPFQHHDIATIGNQLKEIISQFQIQKLLLDFQRPKSEDLEKLITRLCQLLPCAIAATESYAKESPCAVFLSPPSLHCALKDHLAPWQGRKIWLELAIESVCYTITEAGCKQESNSHFDREDFLHHDQCLHVAYRSEAHNDSIVFHLKRTHKEIKELLQEAENLGITTAVGLYQELK